MNEKKKTVLFLANGIGLESKGSFDIYSDQEFPTIARLMNEELSTSLISEGTSVGLNNGQPTDFETGYNILGIESKNTTPFDEIQGLIDEAKFSPSALVDVMNFVNLNNSKLHIYFPIGNKVLERTIDQLKAFIELCNSKGVKTICIHVFVGLNTEMGAKHGKALVQLLDKKVIKPYENVYLNLVCGIKYLKDSATNEEVRALLKAYTNVNHTVVWEEFEKGMDLKYNRGMSDEDLPPLITKRVDLLESNDGFVIFNYEEGFFAKFLDLILNPSKYGDDTLPLTNIKVASLFPLAKETIIPFAFPYQLPTTFVTRQLEELQKKATVVAHVNRMRHIATSLNGGNPVVHPNLKLVSVPDSLDTFKDITSFALQELNDLESELLIIDYDLLSGLKTNTTSELKSNYKKMDDAIKTVLDSCMEKDYTFIFSSLYGIKGKYISDMMKDVVVDFSNKVPYCVVDKVFQKESYILRSGIALKYLREAVFNHLDSNKYDSIIVSKAMLKKARQKRTKLLKLVAGIFVFILIMMIVMTIIQG